MKHLFLLVHGFIGKPDHMFAMQQTLEKQLGDAIEVLVPVGNAGARSFDGVVHCGERVLQELSEFLDRREASGVTFDRISIVGYSMGGLYARYAIGVLESAGFFDTVRPMVFSAFASPHMGIGFFDGSVFSALLNTLGSRVLGISGADMFGGSIIFELADPDSRYFKGLQRFQRLLNFTNAIHDRTVSFYTSFLCDAQPFAEPDRVVFEFFDDSVEPTVFVDMERTTLAEAAEKHPLTWAERRAQLWAAAMVPLLLPVILVVAVANTVASRVRVGMSKRVPFVRNQGRAGIDMDVALADTVGVMATVLDEAHKSSDGHKSLEADSGSVDKSTADSESVDKTVDTDDSESSFKVKPILTTNPPIMAQARKIKLPESVRQIMTNLNTLPWQHYVVQLQRMHSHAEILNRRNMPGQGQRVVEFWVSLVAE